MDAHERRALLEGWEWKRHSEYVELLNIPFANFEINAPIPMFTENELNDYKYLRKFGEGNIRGGLRIGEEITRRMGNKKY